MQLCQSKWLRIAFSYPKDNTKIGKIIKIAGFLSLGASNWYGCYKKRTYSYKGHKNPIFGQSKCAP